MGRDPLDTKLVALQEQAVHLRAQLRGVDVARAALARFSADADQLIAALLTAEAAALAAWVDRDHAVGAMAFAHRTSGELIDEVATWCRLVRRCLVLAGPSWAVSRVRDALPVRFNRFAPLPALIRGSVAALTTHAAALGAPERFDPLRADGASLADRLDAHAAVLETCAQRSTDTAANVTTARAALLAECRVVRAAWAASRVIDPHVPRLDLRIVRAEAAVSRRVRRPDPTTDAAGTEPDPTSGLVSSTPPQGEPGPELITLPTTPPLTEPDGPTTTVRVTATVEVIEADDSGSCESLSG